MTVARSRAHAAARRHGGTGAVRVRRRWQYVAQDRLKNFVNALWDDRIVPSLTEYIRIPSKSPGFDKDWAAHGYMDAAVALMEKWARAQLQRIPGATLEVVRLPGRTPVIFIEIPGVGDEPVLLYGHLDKQPEFTGWAEGLGPWTPVMRGDRLYGRGGADDGYAMYGALAAILALHDQNIPHARCVVLIEACEESGATICLLCRSSGRTHRQSGPGDLPRFGLWRLRKAVAHDKLARHRDRHAHRQGADGGRAFGRCLRDRAVELPHRAPTLLSRLEDEKTGAVSPRGLYVDIPPARVAQAKAAAAILGKDVYAKFPFAGGTRPMADDPAELILNRSWRPQLAVIGAEGCLSPAMRARCCCPRRR